MRGGPLYPAGPVRELLLPLYRAGELTTGARRHGVVGGVSTRTLLRIVYREQETVSEYVLDRILTGVLGDPSLWSTEGLVPVASSRSARYQQRRRLRQLEEVSG